MDDSSTSPPTLAPGDVIAVRRRHQGVIDLCERSAVVLELPCRCPWPCRVRWQDNGLEELVYPRTDLLIERRSDDLKPAETGATAVADS